MTIAALAALLRASRRRRRLYYLEIRYCRRSARPFVLRIHQDLVGIPPHAHTERDTGGRKHFLPANEFP